MTGLAACDGKLRCLGVDKTSKRSAPSYANGRRWWQFFETVFYRPLTRRQPEAKVLKQLMKIETLVGTTDIE